MQFQYVPFSQLKSLIIADTSHNSSILSKSHNLKTVDLKVFFSQGFHIQKADYDLINQFVIHKFSQYIVLNIKDYL